MQTDLRRWMTLCEANTQKPTGNWVQVYRGVPQDAHGFDTEFGVFFSDNRSVAASYAAHAGKVLEALLDVSAALDWTPRVAAAFQDYVIGWQRRERLPPGARKALARFNATWDASITMSEAIGELLREHPNRLGHNEIDPLMGFVRAFVKDDRRDVIIRPHETGGGMMDGTKEYIVFSAKRIKLVGEQPR